MRRTPFGASNQQPVHSVGGYVSGATRRAMMSQHMKATESNLVCKGRSAYRPR